MWWVVVEEQGGMGDAVPGPPERGRRRVPAREAAPVPVKGKTDLWQFRVTVGEQAGG